MKHVLPKAFLFIGVGLLGSAGVQAQTVTGSASIALKNGESAEIGELYWVSNCRSILKGTPEAEVLDGPPGLSVAVKEAQVIPRVQKCANRVPGGMLVVTAKDVKDTSYSPVTIQVTYPTLDGKRKRSIVINVSLFP
jgi:hypothetical protein